MAAFIGRLNTNEFYNSIYNMLRLAYIYADNLSGLDDSLANKYRADGGMYHDKAVYTDMDVLYSRVWDPNDTNVLAPEAVVAPKQQEIVVNKFRQIGLYTDEYLSKRSWQDASTYDTFRAVVQKQVSETKKVYEQKLVDVYVGTPARASNNRMLELPTVAGDDEATNRLQAQAIAKAIGDVFVDMKDSTTNFNANRFVKSFNESDFDIIWNAKYYNKILYTDLPTIFHNDGIVERLGENVLPARYFGDTITTANLASYSAASPAPGKPINSSTGAYTPGAGNANGTIRSLYEMDLKVGGTTTHVRPGDEIPSGFILKEATIVGDGTVASLKGLNLFYIENKKAICKIMHKDAIQYMSGFNSETEFINPRSKTETHYLIFGYSSLPQARLKEYPYITLLEA